MGAELRLPAALVERVRLRDGAAGADWLAALPDLVDTLLTLWRAERDGPLLAGATSLVVPVRTPAGSAVVKVVGPAVPAAAEATALGLFDGVGVVRLLDADLDRGGLLLERLGPQSLEQVDDREHRAVVCGELATAMASVPEPPAGRVRRLADVAGWESQLRQQDTATGGTLARPLVSAALAAIAALADDPTPTLCHGDLSPANVLAGERARWLAVDPTAWVGTAAHDAHTVVRAGLAELARRTDGAERLRRELAVFSAAAGVDPELSRALAQARAVSSVLDARLTGRDDEAGPLAWMAACLT